ncbi:MAG: penicillin acylase family protein [Pseudomonadota bacterium]
MKQKLWMFALVVLTAATGSCALMPSGRAGQHSVEIFRDRYGMAHLYAATEEDGYYGVGYALGEDRLLQVLAWYVAVRGELAKTFGRETPRLTPDAPTQLADSLASDLQARKYRYLDVARNNFGHLPVQYQKNVRAYIAGIRAFMAEHPDKVPAWAPALEPALPLALFHFYVQEARQVCGPRQQFDKTNVRSNAFAGRGSPLEGSNAWVVSGARTDDGGVIFAADSHGLIDGHGNVFYPYRIKAGALDFMAIEPTGTATLLFGHSSRFAWGVTEGPRFVADCYRVRTRKENPDSYEFDGKIRMIEKVPYAIAVKGEPPVTGTFEYTRHNGLLSPVESRTTDSVYVVSYAQAERLGRGAGQYYRMAKATTRAELEKALASGDLYPANLLIGGADGTTMFVRPGGIPIRAKGVDARGTLDGNTSATAWLGIHPWRDMLKLINPPAGYIANTNVSPDVMYDNSSMHEQDYPPYFGFETGKTNERQRRLLEILKDNARMTDAAAIAAVMDETVPAARKWGPQLARALTTGSFDISAQPPGTQVCVAELARFNGEFSRDSRAALYHVEMLRAVAAKADSLARLARDIEGNGPLDRALQEVLVNSAVEACNGIGKKFGRLDPVLGDIFRIGRGVVDLPIGSGQLQGAGVATVRALRFGRPEQNGIQRMTGGQRAPFMVHFTPTGIRSYGMFLYGVSENTDSVHYSDQGQLASDKNLREVPLTRKALIGEGATVRRLRVNTSWPSP